MLSENVVEISTPPGAAGVKLDQLMITRPVSGSTSMNSLSASSTGDPFTSTSPCGFVTGVTSNGPTHVCPQSVERCTPIVCAAVAAENFLTMIDEYTKTHPPRYLISGSPSTRGSLAVPIVSVPGDGSWPPSTQGHPPAERRPLPRSPADLRKDRPPRSPSPLARRAAGRVQAPPGRARRR